MFRKWLLLTVSLFTVASTGAKADGYLLTCTGGWTTQLDLVATSNPSAPVAVVRWLGNNNIPLYCHPSPQWGHGLVPRLVYVCTENQVGLGAMRATIDTTAMTATLTETVALSLGSVSNLSMTCSQP